MRLIDIILTKERGWERASQFLIHSFNFTWNYAYILYPVFAPRDSYKWFEITRAAQLDESSRVCKACLTRATFKIFDHFSPYHQKHPKLDVLVLFGMSLDGFLGLPYGSKALRICVLENQSFVWLKIAKQYSYDSQSWRSSSMKFTIVGCNYASTRYNRPTFWIISHLLARKKVSTSRYRVSILVYDVCYLCVVEYRFCQNIAILQRLLRISFHPPPR